MTVFSFRLSHTEAGEHLADIDAANIEDARVVALHEAALRRGGDVGSWRFVEEKAPEPEAEPELTAEEIAARHAADGEALKALAETVAAEIAAEAATGDVG